MGNATLDWKNVIEPDAEDMLTAPDGIFMSDCGIITDVMDKMHNTAFRVYSRYSVMVEGTFGMLREVEVLDYETFLDISNALDQLEEIIKEFSSDYNSIHADYVAHYSTKTDSYVRLKIDNLRIAINALERRVVGSRSCALIALRDKLSEEEKAKEVIGQPILEQGGNVQDFVSSILGGSNASAATQ